MNSNYELVANNQTTGWRPEFDANTRNDYGMTPAQVAAQAGDVNEFMAITTAPDFDPKKMGSLQIHLHICKHNSSDTFNRFNDYFSKVFQAAFEFDSVRREWKKKGTVLH